MSKGREIAKFLSGFETGHALAHAGLAALGVNVTILGWHISRTAGFATAAVSAVIAVVLGVIGWRGRSEGSVA